MNNSQLKKVAIVLLILLFYMPLIVTMILSAQASAETKQYAGLQVIVMGVYSVPFVLVSLITLIMGRSFQNRLKEKASTISLIISVGSSILGSILMLAWALVGAL